MLYFQLGFLTRQQIGYTFLGKNLDLEIHSNYQIVDDLIDYNFDFDSNDYFDYVDYVDYFDQVDWIDYVDQTYFVEYFDLLCYFVEYQY